MTTSSQSLLRKIADTQRGDPMALIRRLAIVPAILLTFLFFVLPMLRMLQISFYRNLATGLMEPAFIFDNYLRFLGDSYYIARLGQTLFYGVIITVLCFVLGFPLAFVLVRFRVPGRAVLLGIVLYPLLTNSLALVFAWLVMLGDNGPINQLIALVNPGAPTLRILGTPTAVIISMLHAGLPFMVVPLMAAISNIRPSLEDAASSLGASPPRVILHVVLPLAMPGILSGGLLTFTTALSGFLFPLFLGGNTTIIMPLLIYQSVGITANWPFGGAMTFITLLVTLMLVGVGALAVSVVRSLTRGRRL